MENILILITIVTSDVSYRIAPNSTVDGIFWLSNIKHIPAGYLISCNGYTINHIDGDGRFIQHEIVIDRIEQRIH